MARASLPSSAYALLPLVFGALVACSSGAGSPLPSGDGNLAGNAPAAAATTPPPVTTGSTAPTSSTPAPPPPAGEWDAGSDSGSWAADTGTSTVVDSGPGYFIDTSTGGQTPSGPLGSCTNPACATDGNECGCQATDSQGNTVQLGCQAGGECVCVLNGNVDDNPFSENGACNTSQTTAQQFLQYCTCQ
jgi:hypothetical protein